MEEALNTNKYNRKQAKDKLLEILNSPSKFECKERTELLRLFPTVMDLFDWLKFGYTKTNKMIGNRQWDEAIDGKKCPFAIITQKIEAWFVLERVCKSITALYPNAPLFTIHDAIYTTEKHVNAVKEIP